jgi:hypothetical protein
MIEGSKIRPYNLVKHTPGLATDMEEDRKRS